MDRERRAEVAGIRVQTSGFSPKASRQNTAPLLCRGLAVAAVVGLLCSGAAGGITIDLVTVGDAGNVGELSGDPGYGTERLCGAVPYVYQIGKYEVTNTQYTGFLNSVAKFGDPYGLCYRGPWLDEYGIARTGGGTIGNPYVYLAKDGDPNWDNRPVNCVSWYNSLRFINWLQNGPPLAQAGPGVTETGTYTFSDPNTVVINRDWDIVTYYTVAIPDHATLTSPTWVLTTEDEWYKAAYYKAGGTAAGYWDYATQSDTLPDNNPPWLDSGNSANYSFIDYDPNTDQYAVGPPYYMTEVGAYTLSESAYGTYDQNGNVWEVLETSWDVDSLVMRGGGYEYGQYGLPAYARGFSAAPDQGGAPGGFRAALIPEPGTFCLLLTVVPFFGPRRRAK